jgi:hypothetical protein
MKREKKKGENVKKNKGKKERKRPARNSHGSCKELLRLAKDKYR